MKTLYPILSNFILSFLCLLLVDQGWGQKDTIFVTPNWFGSETTWELKTAGGSVVSSGGPYSDNFVLGPKDTTLGNLSDGCYDFVIKDAGGDGICCSGGNGHYEVIRGATGDTLVSGGDFGSKDSTRFCVSSASVSIDSIKTVDVACFGGNDGSIEVFASGNNLKYSIDTGSTFKSDSFFANLQADTFRVVVKDGSGNSDSADAIVSQPSEIRTQVEDTICENDSIMLGGAWRQTGGTYYDTATADNSCDSIIETTLTVRDTAHNQVSEAICENDSIFLGGEWRSSSGTYYDTATAANGCDSIIETTLSVNDTALVNRTASICEGDSILLGGVWRDTAGTYLDSAQTTKGCDSLVFTELTIDPAYHRVDSVSICAGDSIWAGGDYQDTSGTYYDSLSTIVGCDSVIQTVLAVNGPIDLSVNVTDATCGEQNGSIDVQASGGSGDYVYSVDSGATFQSSGSFSPLFSGTYHILVRDGMGCTATTSVSVGDTPELELSVETISAGCDSGGGSILLEASGGANGGPYEYSIDGGNTFKSSGTFTDLAAGTYETVAVENASGCRVTKTVEVLDGGGVFLKSVDVMNVSCKGSDDGSIKAKASGDNLRYSIDGGSTFQVQNTFDSLSVGPYTVVVKDGFGCRDSQDVSMKKDTAIAEASAEKDTVNLKVNGVIQFHGNGSKWNSFLWRFVDGETATDRDPTHNYTQSGTYNVVLITEAGECRDTDTLTVVVVGDVSIEENSLQDRWSVFPNPTNGALTIRLADLRLDSDAELRILDLGGKSVERAHIPQGTDAFEMNLSKLPAGLYWLALETEKGRSIRTIEILH